MRPRTAMQTCLFASPKKHCSSVIYALTVFFALLLAAGSAQAGERLAIKSGTVNVRSGPGTDYPMIWQIERYFPVDVIEKKGNWYRFRDFEGDEGWLHKSLLRKMDTVVTRAVKCNVRSGPSTSTAKVFVVDKGVPFKVISKKGKWIHVEHADGDRGWIHNSLVW